MPGTAIVLSGGGSKGDFEVGALHYLYQKGIRPDILCTTSVGSVNGLKLAEGETGLAGLTRLWLGLTSPGDFFTEMPWLIGDDPASRFVRQYLLDEASALKPETAVELLLNNDLKVLAALEETAVAARRATNDPQLERLARAGVLSLLPTPAQGLSAAEFTTRLVGLAIAAVDVADFVSSAVTATSLFSLAPLAELARREVNTDLVAAWAAAGGKLRMATVALESGELWYVTETGQVLRRDGSRMFRAVAPLPPACQALADALAGAEGDLRANLASAARGDLPGGQGELVRLRQAVRAAREALNACIAQQPAQDPAPVTTSLVHGMLASAAMPAYFSPIIIAGEHCVDGGVRAVLPMEAAVALGPDRIFAIQASEAMVDRLPGKTWTMLDAAMRSLTDIAINELAYRDGRFMSASAANVALIEPRIDIHTTFTVYPAFVRQRMAYGWMCAADAVDPPAEANRARATADRIAGLRYGISRLECWTTNRPVPPHMVMLPALALDDRQRIMSTLAGMRNEVRALVQERRDLGAKVPSGTSDWDDPNLWSFAEVHPGTPSRDWAFVNGSSFPASLPAGAPATLTLTVTNQGTTTWDPALGYRLGSDSPRDNTAWGRNRVELPRPIHPGEAVQVTFTVTVPATVGPTPCVWRMVRDGVAWFGFNGGQIISVVPAGEPAVCAGYRQQIRDLDGEIADLTNELTGDHRQDAPTRAQINAKKEERSEVLQQATAAGCRI